jgi:FkbM family methyltransferase
MQAAFLKASQIESQQKVWEIINAEEIISRMTDEDLGELETNLAKQPSDPMLWLWSGLVKSERSRFAEACVCFEKAIAAGCRHWRANWYMAKAAKGCGRIDLVDGHCAEVLKGNPEFWFARELPKHARGYYAQFEQDAVLERLFSDFPPHSKVFVEVGAFDGVHYSNVRRLVEKYGWSGYCLEPVEKNYQNLSKSYANMPVRCLKVAAGNQDGEVDLNVSTYPHLPSWGSDVASISEAEKDRWEAYNPVWTKEQVPLLTLTTLLDREKCSQVDLLSVDAEGHDLQVLEGIDFKRLAPRVIIVEYGKRRDEILSFLAVRDYSLIEDNGQDLIMARLGHDGEAPQTRNYTGGTGVAPYLEIQRDIEHRLNRVLGKKAAEIRRIVIVGGYLGLEIRHFLANFPKARIDVFEPSRRYFSRLQQAYAGSSRVFCHNVAVGENNGKLSFFEGTMDGVGSLLPLKTAEAADRATWMPVDLRQAESYEVPVIQLDCFDPLKGVALDILWCDVQGAELQVLRGAKKLLRHAESVFLEVATTRTTYQGQCLLGELNEELEKESFFLAGIGLCHTGNGTGNALWLRRDLALPKAPPVALDEQSRALALGKINPHLLTIVPRAKAVEVTTVDPLDLFSPQRFDLAAKTIYARARLAGVASQWPRRLYLEHVSAFNGGMEGDGSGKQNAEAFLSAFDALIDSVRSGGLDPDVSLLPVGANGIIIDGAHRVAAALSCAKAVSCVNFEWESKTYDWKFFASRGLPIPFLDAMALEFCQQLPNAHIVILFPAAHGFEAQAREILSRFGTLFYEKEISLTKDGALALIRQVYRDEPWLGTWADNFTGVQGKTNACFNGRGSVQVLAFQTDSLENVRQAKTQVRDLCKVENHSIHINDTHEETVLLARIFFNNNSVHFLNTGRPKHFERFWRLFELYRWMLVDRGLGGESFCVDGSAVMSLYGIRDAQDLDFLSFGASDYEAGITDVNCHNSEAHHHAISRDEIIFDPANHFFYEGIKFASLETIRRLKVKRNEGKDQLDVESIDALTSGLLDKPELGAAIALARRVRDGFKKLVRRTKKNLYERPKRQFLEQLRFRGHKRSFPKNWFSVHEKHWEQLLLPWGKARGPLRILEIGSYDGQSACWLIKSFLADPRSKLTCIDMWQQRSGERIFEEDMDEVFSRFQRNCQATGKWSQVRVLRGDSKAMLKTLAGEQFDLIYVDGDLSEAGARADTLLVHPLLAPEGLVLWNDYNWCTTVKEGVNQACGELGILLESFGNNVCYRNGSAVTEAKAGKIIGLVPARNEEAHIGLCLRALAKFTDGIIFLDDYSTDGTVRIVESLAIECRVERIFRKTEWLRDEPGDRNRLLEAGRQAGGTHFVVLDADEAFTSNCQEKDILRRLILSLQPGDQMSLAWIQLWRSLEFYRHDGSVWTDNYKCFVFCDDGKCSYSSGFIHTSRAPQNLAGARKIFPGYTHGVLHFQFVNWRNLLLKQSWYRCLERIRDPEKPVQAINELYASSKDEASLGLRPAPVCWLAGYPFFDPATVEAPDSWRDKQIAQWMSEHGPEHFAELDIWDSGLAVQRPLDAAAKPQPEAGPLVSVIVSTYKAERFLRGCIEDLEAQSIADNIEIIVVNSGSPENEKAIVKELQARHRNIVYLETQRETVYGAWNRAIKIARGRYLTNANTDDRHATHALEKLAAALDRRPDIDLVYGNSALTRTENTTLQKGPVNGSFCWPPFDPRLLFNVCFVGPHPMWRRSLHDKFGLFDSNYTSAGDYEFWLRICQKTKFLHLPETLGLYLEHESSIEHANPELSAEESATARKAHWPREWGPLPEPSGTFLQPAHASKAVRLSPPIPASTPTPLVSVIVPTNSRPLMLEEALRSILAQTFKDFEIIVINDGGPDISGLIEKLGVGPKIVSLRHEKSLERSAARNAGLAVARGRFVAYLDDDDVFYPEHLESLLGVLKATGAKVAYTDTCKASQELREGIYTVTERKPFPSEDFSQDRLLVSNFIPNLCVMHEKACVDVAGLFDVELSTHEDWDFLIRMSRHFPFVHLKKVTCEFRLRKDGTNTTTERRKDFLRTLEIVYSRYRMYTEGDKNILDKQKTFLAGLL